MMRTAQYVVLDKIHESSDTLLYRGQRASDSLPVTLKVLRSEYPSPRELARLRHEYGLLQQLNVPGVIKAYGLESFNNSLALVLESVRSTPLNELLRTTRLSLHATLEIAINLAEILDSLHRNGVLHKDIKPHNLLVDPQTHEVVLIDFGVATRLSQEFQRSSVTSSGLEGTLAYMSPEHTGRVNRSLDRRSDLYSFGVMLYEMVTGILPFVAEDPLELVHCHIARRPTPPSEVSQSVPPMVSRVVMKLLAKTPEERYQSAAGLKSDLQECLRRLERSGAQGQIEEFPLGGGDYNDEFRLPQQIYGRRDEIDQLGAVLDSVCRGGTELVLVSGPTGIGKTSLVRELQKPGQRRRWIFLEGRFEQRSWSTPYAALVDALRLLLRQLLAEPAEVLARWRDQLLRALTPNARLLTDMLPELEGIIGVQPAVEPLPVNESANRFALVIQRFLGVVCSADHPLVLFLDDLHCIDSATAGLLLRLLRDPERNHLLLICAYRDKEGESPEPLKDFLAAVTENQLARLQLSLQPLSREALQAIVGDALAYPPADARPLGELLLEKTHGNPLFVHQFLMQMYAEKLLQFNYQTRRWVWDETATRRRLVTANVVDVMLNKLSALPLASQRILAAAACIGFQFDLQTLTPVIDHSVQEIATALWEALRAGLLLPLDEDYRFLADGAAALSLSDERTSAINLAFKFPHDRIQQAAQERLSIGEQHEVELRIGRLLLHRGADKSHEHGLLESLKHLNRGASLLSDGAERKEVARLNLAAAQHSKTSSAHEAAAAYCAAGISLLPRDQWDSEYELSAALHTIQAECEYLRGNMTRADELFEGLLHHLRSRAERARLYTLRVLIATSLGRLDEAVEKSREGLALFGIELPADEQAAGAAFGMELGLLAKRLEGRAIRELIDAPAVHDPELIETLQLLTTVAALFYFVSPAVLFPWLVLKHVNISVQHGHTQVSAYGYILYGFLLAGVMQRYGEARDFGQLALELLGKYKNSELAPKVHFLWGAYSHAFLPLREALEHQQIGHRLAMEAGDYPYVSYTAQWICALRMALGEELGKLREDAGKSLLLLQRTKEATAIALLRLWSQQMACLQGETAGPSSLNGEGFEEETFLRQLREQRFAMCECAYHVSKLQCHFFAEEFEQAFAAAVRAEQLAPAAVNQYFLTKMYFFGGLAAAACHARAQEADREPYRSWLSQALARMGSLAESAPSNYVHRHLLLRAEEARIKGQGLEAERLYDLALEAAQENGFIHDEALINELCGLFYFAQERRKLARIYLTDAHYAYERWGAMAKARQLAAEHPSVLLRETIGRPATRTATGSRSASTSSRRVTGAMLDIKTVLRAAQTIASEIVFEKVVHHLMRIVVTNAGAQRSVLVLSQDGHLSIEAALTVDPETAQVGMRIPLVEGAPVPLSVIQYVLRTRETLVLGDAVRDPRFGSDPYIQASQIKSVLAIALTHQGRVTGALYLENNLTTDAFTSEGTEILQLLSTQAAISIENALLYRHVQSVTDKLRRSNQDLSLTNDQLRETSEQLKASYSQLATANEQLKTLTSELQQSNESLLGANQRLQVELEERARTEAARAQLQEEIIREKTARLAELSSPLIPISNDIMVMPLIGTMDSQRANQVLETMLTGIETSRAKVVIIDITGMRNVDTSVASTLLKTGAAVRLLGAQAILTGIRAEVAQTLIGLGVDLGSITTRATLQSGIAYAVSQVAPRGGASPLGR
jgi:predicted ATPase/GAF domain-containing protein